MRADTSENYIPIGMYILSTCASRKNSSSKNGRSTSFLVPKNDEPRRLRKLARSSKEDLPPVEAPQLGRTVEIEILIPPSLINGIVRDYEEYRKNPIDLVQIRVIIYGPGCSLFFQERRTPRVFASIDCSRLSKFPYVTKNFLYNILRN